jgi:starvation-inducible DNA-binding protein
MSTVSIATEVFPPGVIADVGAALRQLLADVFALYVKTKSFHWHVVGPHFRDDHLLLDEQAAPVFAMIDEIAERARKIGGSTIHSVGEISRVQTLRDDDRDGLSRVEMLDALLEDNRRLATSLRAVHELCDRAGDIATTSLIETWLDETERRIWFLNATLSGR